MVLTLSLGQQYKCVVDIGHTIREIRKQSPYKDLKSYASKADLSGEGLRKIEIGETIPTKDNLEKLIKVGRVPREVADQLMKARAMAQAKRDGIDIQPHVSEETMEALADKTTHIAVTFLGEFDADLRKSERRELRDRLLKGIRKELSA